MPRSQPARWLIIAAFAAVYLIWGSTYIAMRFALESLPPFLLMGSRFAVAGIVLILLARAQGAPMPTRRQWGQASIVGALLFLVNNGILSWGMQHIPSGIAALLVASVAMWFAVLEWLFKGMRPTSGATVGLLLGFSGLGLLISPDQYRGGTDVSLYASIAIVFGTLAWASGSLYSRRADLPTSPAMSTGMQLLTGGLLLIVLDILSGEIAQFRLDDLTLRSGLAWLYLWTFGSVVAFSAYTFLLRFTPATQASTYAFVNPVVALFLGWLLGGEQLSVRTLVAAGIIVLAVALIILSRHQTPKMIPRAAEVTEAG